MTYTIRPAIADDIDTLLSLIHQKAEFDGCPEAVTATAPKLAATLFGPTPLAYVLLAEPTRTPPQPVGFASYHFTHSTFLAQPSLWLDDLFVCAAHRNQGIGARLINCQLKNPPCHGR